MVIVGYLLSLIVIDGPPAVSDSYQNSEGWSLKLRTPKLICSYIPYMVQNKDQSSLGSPCKGNFASFSTSMLA